MVHGGNQRTPRTIQKTIRPGGKHATVPSNRKEAYFEMIQYPVQASNEMNKKMLYAQFARHTPVRQRFLWKKSDAAYDSIVSLTRRFNSLLDGKWNHIISTAPRGLIVFDKVKRTASSMALVSSPPATVVERHGT